MVMTLSVLLGRVLRMREMWQLGLTSLEASELLNAKRQARVTLLTSAVGRKRLKFEATHYAEARQLDRRAVLPAVIIKARGKSIDDAYLVMRLGDVFK
jgi:hypothetical protein